MEADPEIARPTRQVSPTTRPARLRMQEMRWRVLSIPARLSPPKSPTCARGGGGSTAAPSQVWASAQPPYRRAGGRCSLLAASGPRPPAAPRCAAPHLLHRELQVLLGHRPLRQADVAPREPRQRRAAQVHHDLQQLLQPGVRLQAPPHRRRQQGDELVRLHVAGDQHRGQLPVSGAAACAGAGAAAAEAGVRPVGGRRAPAVHLRLAPLGPPLATKGLEGLLLLLLPHGPSRPQRRRAWHRAGL